MQNVNGSFDIIGIPSREAILNARFKNITDSNLSFEEKVEIGHKKELYEREHLDIPSYDYKEELDITFPDKLRNILTKAEHIKLQRNFCENEEEARLLALEINRELELPLMSYGTHRGLYKCNPTSLLKIALTVPSKICNYEELKLFQAIPSTLKRWLCPITKLTDVICKVTFARTDKPVDNSVIANMHALFADNGFDLADISEQKQWGWIHGQPVLLDYANWKYSEETWESKMKKQKELINRFIKEDLISNPQ